MTSDSGKKTQTGKKAAQEKPGKQSARSRTIELTAEDVTPEKEKSAKAKKTPQAEQPAPPDEQNAPASKKTPEKNKNSTAYLFAAFLGAVLALAGGYGLLALNIVALPDNSKAALLAAVSDLEKQLKADKAMSEESFGSLATALEKTGSRGQVRDEMLGATNAAVAALKEQLAQMHKITADLTAKTDANAALVAKAGETTQKALAASADLSRKLAEESKLRAGLGPQIAANTAQIQKRALDAARLAKAIEQNAALAAKAQARIDDLFKGIKDIEKAVSEAGVSAGGTPSSAGVRISLLDRKLKRLEQDMAGLNKSLQSMPAVPPDLSPQISVLEKSLMRLSKGMAELGGRDAERQDALRRLQEKTGIISGKMAEIDVLSKRATALDGELGALRGEISNLARAVQILKINDDGGSGTLDTLSGRLDALKSELAGRIAGLEKLLAGIADAEKKLAAIDARLAEVKSLQERIKEQQSIAARVQLANRLQRDMMSGKAFKRALSGFAAIAPDIKIPQNISAAAGQGIISMARLRRDFGQLREELEAQNILEGGEGLMGKIMKSAGSVVSVRRAGPTAGDSPGAIASRVAAYLEKDDLASAIAEAGGFKGEAAKKVAPWLAAARVRLDAEHFSRDLGARIYAGAAGGKGE